MVTGKIVQNLLRYARLKYPNGTKIDNGQYIISDYTKFLLDFKERGRVAISVIDQRADSDSIIRHLETIPVHSV